MSNNTLHISQELAEQIFVAFLCKTKEETIVLYYGQQYVTDRLDTFTASMTDPHIPLYVFEGFDFHGNDIQFTVRVINIGCHDEIITVGVTED